MSEPRSVRFDDDVLQRLTRYLREHPGSSASSVTNMFVDEALRCEEHPGLVFRPGPTGRRAALSVGPDIWEVIAALRAVRAETPDLDESALLAELASVTGLATEQVRVALRYYAAFPGEVDERIDANEEFAERAERLWLAERELLRGRPE